MKLKIDDTLAVAVIKAALKEHMEYLEKNVKELSAEKSLTRFQETDLLQDLTLLNAMKEVHNYNDLPEDQIGRKKED